MIFKRIKDVWQGKAFFIEKRSNQWPWIRQVFLKKNPKCCVCGTTKNLEVHHIIPFQYRPDLELVESNLITLCESKKKGVNCHLFFGHLGDYVKYNPSVIVDANIWKLKIDDSGTC
jgi:5-methylcytosine-specific restriction protein A